MPLTIHVRRTARTALAGLAGALALAAPAGAATFGNTTVGAVNGNGFSEDVKRCTTFPLTETGSVSDLRLYTGGTPGFPGSQVVRGVVYAMSGGAPGALKATTSAITVNAGDPMAWRTLAISPAVTLPPGTYCLGTHTGGAVGVADFRYTSVPGSWFKSDDEYDDGATNPFGSPSATGDIQMSIHATYTPGKTCTKYASTAGLDTNAGTVGAPYKTVGKLLSVLTSGQTGCLIPGGTFVQKVTVGNGVTLKTAPGYTTRATLRGRIYVPDTSNDVWVDNIALSTTNRDLGLEIGLQVTGDDFKLTNSDVYGDGTVDNSSCIILGISGYGRALNPIVERNRIHGCGGNWANHDHGIYASLVTGGAIRDNLFYDTPGGWDLHVYPDADGMAISHNTLDGSRGGIIIAGEGAQTSDNNTFTNNISTNPTTNWAVQHYWNAAVGTGNTMTGTCVYSPAGRTFETPIVGYTHTGSITADPLYVNRAAKDFRLQPGSPCAGKGVRP